MQEFPNAVVKSCPDITPHVWCLGVEIFAKSSVIVYPFNFNNFRLFDSSIAEEYNFQSQTSRKGRVGAAVVKSCADITSDLIYLGIEIFAKSSVIAFLFNCDNFNKYWFKN